MTTAMRRLSARINVLVAAGLVVLLLTAAPAPAIQLDDRGEMRLGLRTYFATRMNTEAQGGPDDPLSWPNSGTGHIRQERFFLQLKFDHDLKRIGRTPYGWAWLLGGFANPDVFSYSLQYRGEGEGIYDWGADEWQHQRRALDNNWADVPNSKNETNPVLKAAGLDPNPCHHFVYVRNGKFVTPKFAPGAAKATPPPGAELMNYCDERVDKLRRLARQRHRFYAGYVDWAKGPVSLRLGRQVLAWGETDIFRLLDNINPLDAGFGGFLIALDERRVPIDMLTGAYQFGSFGEFSDISLQGFLAEGNRVSLFPGIPNGSAWSPGGIAFPNTQIRQNTELPDFTDFRGGGKLGFNYRDFTFNLAHYYTYFDNPAVRYTLPGKNPCNDTDPLHPTKNAALVSNSPRYCSPIIAHVTFPRVQVTGASMTFPVPTWYSIVRSEIAYNRDEPFNRQGTGDPRWSRSSAGTAQYNALVRANNTQGGLDPFVYPAGFDVLGRSGKVEGSRLLLNTFNAAVGLDVNRFIRWLNPTQTFLVSGQLFYKHVFDSPGDLVLPTPHHNQEVPLPLPGGTRQDRLVCKTKSGAARGCALEPRLFHLNDDQFTNTLLITTSYAAGQIVPSVGVLYDWQGALAFQPGVAFVRDPWRLVFDYSYIAGPPTGQIGNLRDRDNVRLQAEFVF